MRAATAVKIEKIATMSLLGLKTRAIASELDCSPKTVEAIRARPEYRIRINSLHKEAMARMDAIFFAAREAILNPEISPDEVRLIAARALKNPF